MNKSVILIFSRSAVKGSRPHTSNHSDYDSDDQLIVDESSGKSKNRRK